MTYTTSLKEAVSWSGSGGLARPGSITVLTPNPQLDEDYLRVAVHDRAECLSEDGENEFEA
ncbi:hypothetical protein ACX80G_17020 [Arthrobacter sp. HLT1-21]